MKSSKVVAEKVIGAKCQGGERSFTDKDSILYALGIGFSRDPMKTEDYKYTSQFEDDFQSNRQVYTAFPTFITCLCNLDIFSVLAAHQFIPEFNPFMILHAEERIEVFKPLKIGINYKNEAHISDVIDKGKIALFVFKSHTTFVNNGKEQLVATTQNVIAIKGLGGFNYKGNGTTIKIPERPHRNPDFILQDESYPGQAFLYRLSGDPNPLHIKPEIAAVQSFPQPIIHGLASYGIVARALIQKLFKNNANALKVYHVRFVGHVFPGEKYRIEVWKESDYYWFRAVIAERSKECIIGYLILHQGAKL